METIVQKHSENFAELTRAFKNGEVALVDCIERSTGEHVAVICAVSLGEGHEYQFTPFAKFFNGNPFELLVPPTGEPAFSAANKERRKGR
jgi:hypothetical protein